MKHSRSSTRINPYIVSKLTSTCRFRQGITHQSVKVFAIETLSLSILTLDLTKQNAEEFLARLASGQLLPACASTWHVVATLGPVWSEKERSKVRE